MSTGAVHPQVAQAIAAFAAVAEQIKSLAGDDRQIYLREVRKLCLAVQAADESRRAIRRARQQPRPGLLVQEVRHQVLSFAHLRCLDAALVAQAAKAADAQYTKREDPGISRAGLLVRELEQRTGGSSGEEFQIGLGLQPLTAILAEHRALLEQLELLYPFCVDYTYQTLYQTAKELEATKEPD